MSHVANSHVHHDRNGLVMMELALDDSLGIKTNDFEERIRYSQDMVTKEIDLRIELSERLRAKEMELDSVQTESKRREDKLIKERDELLERVTNLEAQLKEAQASKHSIQMKEDKCKLSLGESILKLQQQSPNKDLEDYDKDTLITMVTRQKQLLENQQRELIKQSSDLEKANSELRRTQDNLFRVRMELERAHDALQGDNSPSFSPHSPGPRGFYATKQRQQQQKSNSNKSTSVFESFFGMLMAGAKEDSVD